ncbi:MAG: 1-acyl-sn-glycerol-3-phosphate acyltransferase [Spirochaetia bacterium]|nr:1-acyl-sn-glycerol-3-phosphate acyltransferase [Spirochaetia bacterium]
METLLKYVRVVVKFSLSLVTLVLFFISGCIAFIIPARNMVQKRKQLMVVATWGCNIMLRILNVKVIIRNKEIFESEKNWYIMGNHMSYIDILMLLANFHTLFITSKEMGSKPILGQICFFGGSFFVERRKITTLGEEIPRISRTLGEGLNITLFPEGRCSDGKGLLPFRSALIEAAVSSGVNVLPLCIMYTDISGRPVKVSDFMTIGYFNGLPFPRQFTKMLMQKSLTAEIEILDPVRTEGKDRKEIKREIFEKMNYRYNSYLEGRF